MVTLFLSIKMVMLLGSDKIPSVFPGILLEFNKHQLILILCGILFWVLFWKMYFLGKLY